MGPGAGAARRAARHRARPEHAAAGAPAGADRPLRRAHAARCPTYAEAFQEIGPAAIKLGQALATRPDLVGEEAARDLQLLQDSLPPAPFEADPRGDRAGAGAAARAALRATSIRSRSAPPRSPRSTAPITTDGQAGRGQGAAARTSRRISPARSRPTNGRRRRSRRWAARRRGCGRGWSSPTSGNGPTRELDLRREAASASELRENLIAESGFFVPADRLDAHRRGG